ncbi:MAG TPA: rod shape-determining protein MreC [Candidatus Acidoferrum sp.]
MAAIPSRHKSLVLLAGVILLQVLLLAVQIKRDSQGRLIRTWTVGAVSPFERAGSYVFGSFRDTWRSYFALRGTKKDNDDLRRENDALKMRVAQLEAKAAEADRLAALLRFRQSQEDVPMVAARVIGGGPSTASFTIQLDRGEHDGIRKDMGVITPDGVVGKIIEAYPNTSQVLLLTDKDSGVGAKFADSGAQHPVGGVGESILAMKYVPNDDDVNVGESVVTSGMDRIFPRDLPVGTIKEVKPGNPFKQIRVKPAANLDKLEEVLVLLTLRPLKGSDSAAAAPAKPATAASNPPPVANP